MVRACSPVRECDATQRPRADAHMYSCGAPGSLGFFAQPSKCSTKQNQPVQRSLPAGVSLIGVLRVKPLTPGASTGHGA